MALWLDPISPVLRPLAVAALDDGDVGGFLCKASNEDGLDLIVLNAAELRERGLYESGLLGAFTSIRTNHHCWHLRDLRGMFATADRERILAAGDPLPGSGPFTVFRGVAGRGRARRIRGLSWTASLESARWFAERYAETLADPAVFRVQVAKEHVLAYANDREEQEFIVILPESARPVRVWP